MQYLEEKVSCVNWKLYYSRVHGQIHLAVQFTSGVLWHFENVPWKAGFLVLKGKKMRPPPPCNSKTKSQRSEPKWLLKYLITPNFCAKFQPNRLTTTFGPWNTFSDNDTFKVLRDRPPPSLFDWIIGGPTWVVHAHQIKPLVTHAFGAYLPNIHRYIALYYCVWSF